MKEYYYCLDGKTVDGPHSGREIAELYQGSVLKPETLVCAAGDKDWSALATLQLDLQAQPAPAAAVAQPTLDKTDIVTVDHSAVASAGSDKDDDDDDEKADKDTPDENKGLSKYQLLKAVRADLDMLWKAQRESLISNIRGLDLDPDFETTRKQAKAIKSRVREACLEYWRKNKSYDGWIEDLVWKDCDIQRRLRGNGCEEKYEDATNWLTEAKLIDEAGCYCFKSGKQYLYIGKAGVLGNRLHDHLHSVYFEKATHLRIIIPRYKMWISRLERLLLLNYPHAEYNDATPAMGHNRADEILSIMASEMDDLLTDG